MKKTFEKWICLGLSLLTVALSACGKPETAPADGDSQSQEQSKEDNEAMNDSNYTYGVTEEKWNDVLEKTTVPADKELLVKALQATVLAYYNKNPYCQYDETYLTKEGYARSFRNTWEYGPEYADLDQMYYSVCNTYPTGVYLDAFNYFHTTRADGLPYVTKEYNAQTESGFIYCSNNNSEANIQTVINEIKAIIEPGDIVAGYGNSGHALMYVGDIFGDGRLCFTHCWGANLNADGTDHPEPDGSIYIQPADEVVFGPTAGKPNWVLSTMSHSSVHVTVYRPFAMPDFKNEVTETALSRIKYPDLVIHKNLDVTKYNTVVPGQELTLTVEVKNVGKADFTDLVLEENVPVGTELVSGELKKTVNVPAGGSATMTATVRVTAKPGEKVLFSAGAVDKIPTRRILLNVACSKLSDEQQKKLTSLAMDANSGKFKAEGDLALVNMLYKELTGKEIGLPNTVSEYLNLRMKSVVGGDAHMLDAAEVTEETKYLAAMEVPHMFGGLYRICNYNREDRLLDLMESYFMPGDVLVRLDGANETKVLNDASSSVYIYLGKKTALRISEGKASVVDFGLGLDTLYASNQFFVLRPSVPVTY